MSTLLGDPFIYWTLKTLLLMVLAISGYFISYKCDNDAKYWRLSLLPILAYSLEMGLRWNRSWDYPSYYEHLKTGVFEEGEFIYRIWIDYFHATGLPVYYGFIIYSFILIFAFCLVLKENKEYAFIALPLLMLIPGEMAENHIRQFFAFAFILIGYYYLLKSNFKYNILCFFTAISIHGGAIFSILLIWGCWYLPFRKVRIFYKSPWPIILVYLMFFFFWDSSLLTGFADFVSKHIQSNEDVRVSRYIDDADYWLTDESNIFSKMGITSHLPIYFIALRQVFVCGTMYFGHAIACIKKEMWIPFGIFIFCSFNNVIGGDNELFNRLTTQVYIFEAFLYAGIMVDLPMKKVHKNICWGFLLYFFIYSFIRSMFQLKLTGYAYVWDM